jgi:hypothetical protein
MSIVAPDNGVVFALLRENVGENRLFPAGLTVPVIVEPLSATNETDAPGIAALVTVTTCVPADGESVHFTLDLPSLSVAVELDESDPPPTAVQVSATPDTGRWAPSMALTTNAESSADPRFPD